MADELRKEGIKQAMQFCGNYGLEFAQSIPELDTSVVLNIPGLPGNVSLFKSWCFRVFGMCNEADSTSIPDAVDQCLWVIGQGGKISVGVEDQQVVFLRVPVLVVNLLSNQEQ